MSDTIEVGNTVPNGAVPNGAVPTDVEPRAGVVGTDFLTFAVGGGANIEAQTDYLNDPQRPTGNLPGLARSNFNNKAIRQGTFVAHSLSLWISQQLVQYIPDDGNDIAWIGEWTQALSNYMLALIPPGPNLGAYLPLAGGTMSGNISFVSGVSTILANNTWYFAKDTGGTNRGLIIKSNDNNIYINDGSSTYVNFNGTPTVVNNISWSGKTTGAVVRPLIGLLSDNMVHVGSSATTNVFLDCAATGGIYLGANAILPNNQYVYFRDTGNAPRAMLGLDNTNKLLIGSGTTTTTEIYGATGIYLHNTTIALGQMNVNGFLYMQGGARCYIPGGNDPFQIYADQGFYARNHYVVGGTRDWSVGCEPGGTYLLADETAHAVRFSIDLNGAGHFYGGLGVAGTATLAAVGVSSFTCSGAASVSNGLTVQNSLNVASGNLTVSGGTYTYGGLQVWNGLTINSGNFLAAAAGQVNNGLTVYNNINMASGTMWVNGPINLYSSLYLAGNADFRGTLIMQGAANNVPLWLISNPPANNCAIAFTLNGVQSWTAGVLPDGSFGIYIGYGTNTERFYLDQAGTLTLTGSLYVNGGGVFGGALATYNHLSANYGLCVGGAATNLDYTVGFAYNNHTQWYGGLGCYAAFFTPYSDERYKENVEEVERDALAALLPIRLYQYDRPRISPKGEEVRDNRSHVATGVLAQQVMKSLPDAVVETEELVKFHELHPETGEVLCDWETRPSLGVDLMTLCAYQIRAIQQLAERIEALEAAA